MPTGLLFGHKPPQGDQLHFKKDAVWKPLIRQFRRFLKKDALSAETYQNIHSAKLKL